MPIAVLGEEGNWALRRARGDDPDHPPFESALDFIRALRTQTFVSRTSPPPMVRVQSLKIPARLLSRVRPGDVLTLSPSPLPDGTTPISTRVVAREEFRIGRSPVDADLVTWFQPRNAENDETHPPPEQGALLFAAARRTPDGARLRQFQRHGAGWTSPLPRHGDRRAAARKRRHLARHALCHRFPLAARLASGRPQIDNLPQWAGAATAASGSSPGSVVLDPAALGGLVFEPRSPATMRRAVWLLSGLAFGCDPSLALHAASADGLRPVQGYIHHHLGHFWLENLDGNGAVVLDGIMLGANEIAPLTNGLRLRIGASEFVLDVE